MSEGPHITNKRSVFGLPSLFTLGLGLCISMDVQASEVGSVVVDRAAGEIVIKGSGFTSPATITLGGLEVPAGSVTASQIDIPFSTEVATAVMWRATYRLSVDGAADFSVYIKAAIDDPAPPPPPPPPSGGTDCPCIAGWEASAIPKDNWSWCNYGLDGTQDWIYANRDSFFISSAFDPNNIFFDPVDPGNSISYCALHDGTSWTVAEPVVNKEQFDDCEVWMWVKICI